MTDEWYDRAILHVTSEYPPVHFGGLGTAVAGLTQALREAGARVVVLLVHGSNYGYGYGYGYGSLYGHARSYGGSSAYGLPPRDWAPPPAQFDAEIERVHLSYEEGLTAGPALARAAGARVVHLHSSWLWPVAAAIREATEVPVVYTAHSIDRAEVEHGEWLPHGSIQDQAFENADRIVAVSSSEQDYLTRHYPQTTGRLSVVGNGIHLVPAPAVKRHRTSTAVVLYAGRFGTRKGLWDVFKAIPIIAGHVPDAHFLFVGGASPDDGPVEAAAWAPPSLRRYKKRMTFLGWQHSPDNRLDWYDPADVLLVPSRYEPFGMVLLEGMIRGQAIVAADAGGPAELLEHGRTALLYRAGDTSELAAAVVRLLGDVALRRRLGRDARAEVCARWSWRKVVPTMLDTYSRAIDGGGA